MGIRKTVSAYIKCPECNNTITIQRIVGRQKKHGHIKDIYCPFCIKDVKGIEVKGEY